MKLQAKIERARTNYRRAVYGPLRSSTVRRSMKWARVVDRLLVRPGGPLFFLSRMGKTPH